MQVFPLVKYHKKWSILCNVPQKSGKYSEEELFIQWEKKWIVQIYVLAVLAKLASVCKKPLEKRNKFKSYIQGGPSCCSQYQTSNSTLIQTSFSLWSRQRGGYRGDLHSPPAPLCEAYVSTPQLLDMMWIITHASKPSAFYKMSLWILLQVNNFLSDGQRIFFIMQPHP